MMEVKLFHKESGKLLQRWDKSRTDGYGFSFTEIDQFLKEKMKEMKERTLVMQTAAPPLNGETACYTRQTYVVIFETY